MKARGASMHGVRRWPALGLALTVGPLVAGCGHSSTSTVTSTSGAASTAPTGPSTAATGAPATKVAPPGSSASRAQRAAACVRAIGRSTLPARAKPRMVQACEEAASLAAATPSRAAREACVELVNASHIRSGRARQRAIAICNAG